MLLTFTMRDIYDLNKMCEITPVLGVCWIPSPTLSFQKIMEIAVILIQVLYLFQKTSTLIVLARCRPIDHT